MFRNLLSAALLAIFVLGQGAVAAPQTGPITCTTAADCPAGAACCIPLTIPPLSGQMFGFGAAATFQARRHGRCGPSVAEVRLGPVFGQTIRTPNLTWGPVRSNFTNPAPDIGPVYKGFGSASEHVKRWSNMAEE
ncbi:hypothetical protein B0H19DRAFT_1066431 [Mycena capillaripes]|nr:hypothetical protein B0H19DRAFT_1066431 [Mycena capillaripes]